MTIPVSDVLQRVGSIMLDDAHVRWTVRQIIGWLNDSGKEIIIRRPHAFSETVPVQLVAGTRQKLAGNDIKLLDVIRNLNSDASPGRAISITDRKSLDEVDPDWHSSTPGTSVHYTHDARTPATFYVYPPAVAGSSIEVVVAQLPDDIPPVDTVEAATGSYPISPEYLPAIVNYIAYRCNGVDSEYAESAQTAQAYYAAFIQTITDTTAGEQAASPEKASI